MDLERRLLPCDMGRRNPSLCNAVRNANNLSYVSTYARNGCGMSLDLVCGTTIRCKLQIFPVLSGVDRKSVCYVQNNLISMNASKPLHRASLPIGILTFTKSLQAVF